jgi:putative NADH-flavin reductase
MRILIFGSTGSVGKLLIKQALEENHHVTAFARNPMAISILHPNLSVIRGDVIDQSSVEQAMPGHDAVICTLGAGRKGTVRAVGTQNIIAAMQIAGIKRFICQSTLGAGDSKGNLNFFWKYIMFGMLLREAYADHRLQESYVMQSDLDWTIVRPAAFTDGPRTQNYAHGFNSNAKGLTLKVSRADVADFLLKQLSDLSYLRKAPGQSY